MSATEKQLRRDLQAYADSKSEFLASSLGKKLEKKLRSERKKQESNGISCFARVRDKAKSSLDKDKGCRIRYYENKLFDHIKLACADQLRELKQTAKECRNNGLIDPKNKHLQQAHRILYTEKFRKSKRVCFESRCCVEIIPSKPALCACYKCGTFEELLDAIEMKQGDKLDAAISKTYQRSPLAKALRQELETAERVLAYVKRRDRVQRGSTWKFEYEPDQAGYNLSYWVGSDQYWLRNRYRKAQLHGQTEVALESIKEAKTSRPAMLQSGLDETPTEDDVERPRGVAEAPPCGRHSPAEREVGDGAADEAQDTKIELRIRERLHKAVWSESFDVVEIQESLFEFESRKLEDSKALCNSLEECDVQGVVIAIENIDADNLRNELQDIVAEAEEFLRRAEAERRQRNLKLVWKKKLRRSMQSRNICDIKDALVNVFHHKLEIKLREDVSAAEALLSQLQTDSDQRTVPTPTSEKDNETDEILQMKQLLEEAIKSANISRLDAAIKSIKDKALHRFLEKELNEALSVLATLKERLAFRKSVAEIPARYVSEVRSYVNPPPGVYQVMRATFVLLGYAESNLKTWKDVQSHLGKTGTESFRFRVVQRDDNAIDVALVVRAQSLLSSVSLENAENLSLLVNLFYRYCQATIEETTSPHQAT